MLLLKMGFKLQHVTWNDLFHPDKPLKNKERHNNNKDCGVCFGLMVHDFTNLPHAWQHGIVDNSRLPM